jgi:NADPH-dependent curcumin reductase CurA
MTAEPPHVTRQIRLVTTPEQLPGPEHLAVVETALPAPGPGQVVVHNRYFLVFPGLRTLIGGGADGVPLPPVHVGEALFGPAVGEVVAVGPGSGLRPGDKVSHLLGWREHALLAEADCAPLSDALPDPVAHLSSGAAAYAGLTRLAALRPGDTVLVTGAAGAVGTLAGQVARLLGAGRVVGSTRSPHKAERLQAELGYDAVVVAGAAPFAEQLTAAAPDGIDVLLDTVGGEQLNVATHEGMTPCSSSWAACPAPERPHSPVFWRLGSVRSTCGSTPSSRRSSVPGWLGTRWVLWATSSDTPWPRNTCGKG